MHQMFSLMFINIEIEHKPNYAEYLIRFAIVA